MNTTPRRDRNRRGVVAFVVIGFLLAAASGCGEQFHPPSANPCGRCAECDCSPIVDRGTPGQLVSFFAEVQSTPVKDITEYERSLHPGYQFHFLPSELPPGSTEDYWTREEDVNATQDLFNAAISITAHMTLEDSVATGPCDPGTPGVICTGYNVLVDLTVVAPDPRSASHEITSFLVNGRAEFVITRDPSDSTLYVIREIRDHTGQADRTATRTVESASLAGLGSSQVSMGELRAILREDAALARGR